MEKSESIKNLAIALNHFNFQQETIKFNSENPFLKNKYADLTALIEGTKKHLKENGLSVIQLLENSGVTTMLMHISGEWINSTFKIESTDAKGLNLAQTMGVAITYSRRYAYASILNLVTDKDTDGADDTNKKGNANSTTKPNVDDDKKWLNENTKEWDNAIMHLKGNGTIDDIADKYKVSKKNRELLKNQSL